MVPKTRREVFIAANILADTASLAGKCQASLLWGTKAANADLQLASLLAAERDTTLRRALLTVGKWALIDEASLRTHEGSTVMCCFPVAPINGTPWRLFKETKAASPTTEDKGNEVTLAAPPGLELPSKESGVPAAETAEKVDQQQRGFVDGTPLTGTTVIAHRDDARMTGSVADDAAPIGERQAFARFPQMGDKESYLFNNDPRNLEAAKNLRDKGVGRHNPSVREQAAKQAALEELKGQLWTDSAMRKSLNRYEQVNRTAMPKKLSEEQKAQWWIDSINEAEGNGVSYSRMMTAFVKAEVSAKPKPRPIANHKEIRLMAMAKVAWVFEDVMFHALEQMSIKHRAKAQALSDISKNLSEMKRGRWCENDLTAFEFGIGEELKHAECEILRHIAGFVGLEEVGSLLFERVCSDREKSVVWTMRYKDESGEYKTFKMLLDRPMRESGDRLTSSGNFFQNLLAWLSFLVDAAHMKSAVASLIKTHGMSLFYISSRDGKKYLARLVFEGDDTLGRCEEALWESVYAGVSLSLIDDFFFRWGWSPKLLWKKEQGEDYARVVGYDILLRDNQAVVEGDRVVACPEMKRLLNTKNWTTTSVTPEQRKTCCRIFASVLAQEFDRAEPFYAFCKGMYDANGGGTAVTDEMLREQYIQVYGELPEHGSAELQKIEFPEFVGAADDRNWRALARVSCGEFTDVEWATASAVPDMRVHGADLRTHYPRSWIS